MITQRISAAGNTPNVLVKLAVMGMFANIKPMDVIYGAD